MKGRNKLYKILLALSIEILFFNSVRSQFLFDSIQDFKLRSELIKESGTLGTNEKGENIPLEDVYKETSIVVRNLVTDSLVEKISTSGFYLFTFSEINSRPSLLFYHNGTIDFFMIRKENDIKGALQKIEKLLAKYFHQATLEEKLKLYQNIFKVLYRHQKVSADNFLD